jgi:hypothetical protein
MRFDFSLEVHFFLLKLTRQPPHRFFTALALKRVRKIGIPAGYGWNSGLTHMVDDLL